MFPAHEKDQHAALLAHQLLNLGTTGISNRSFLVIVLCTEELSTTSLAASTTSSIPVTATGFGNQNVSRYCQMPPGGKKRPPLRTIALNV